MFGSISNIRGYLVTLEYVITFGCLDLSLISEDLVTLECLDLSLTLEYVVTLGCLDLSLIS